MKRLSPKQKVSYEVVWNGNVVAGYSRREDALAHAADLAALYYTPEIQIRESDLIYLTDAENAELIAQLDYEEHGHRAPVLRKPVFRKRKTR